MHKRKRGVPRGIHRSHTDPQVQIEYDVFCVGERPLTLEDVRQRPVLAPIAALTPGISEADLPALQQLLQRARLPREQRGELEAITYFLAARRFGKKLLQSFRRSETMQESAIYKIVTDEARTTAKLETLRDNLLKLTRHRLGRVPRGLPGKLKAMDADALDRLFDRVLETEDPKALRALLTALPSRS